jgi:hypothetical protein
MAFEVRLRKDEEGIAGAAVRIEYAGGALDAVTDEDGLATFAYDRAGPVTIVVDGQRRGTYDYADTQSVTVLC